MATREEKIAFIKSKMHPAPMATSQPMSREEKLQFVKSKLAATQEPETAEITQKESFARGAAQGASLGFADELTGGAEALWEKANGDPRAFGEMYKQFRDESRANFEAAQKANPGTYATGEIGAAIGTAFIPGMAIAKGARLGQVALKSAAIGAGAGAGYSEAEDMAGVAKDAAVGGAIGGGLGAASHAVAPVVGRAIQKGGEKLKRGAERMASRALGAERGTIKKFGQEQVQKAGRQALDEGVLSPLASADDMAAKNAAVKQRGGQMMGEVYDAIDEKGASTFNPLEVAGKVDEEIGGIYRSPINKGELKQLENTLESILVRGEGNLPLREAQKLKQELSKVANWKNNLNITEKEKMAREAYGIVSSAIDDAADKGAKTIGVEGLPEKLGVGKKIYSNASTSEKLLENRIAREQGNNFFGLTDTIAGAGSLGYGATTGDWGTAAGIMVAKKGLGKYGSQNAALLLDKAGKAITRSSTVADKVARNPNLIDRAVGGSLRQKLPRPEVRKIGEEEPKGESKWANDGLNKIKEHNPKLAGRFPQSVMDDRNAKSLLIQASDLKPGSKAWNNLMERIEREYGASSSKP